MTRGLCLLCRHSAWTYVATRTCLHSGSWVPSCFFGPLHLLTQPAQTRQTPRPWKDSLTRPPFKELLHWLFTGFSLCNFVLASSLGLRLDQFALERARNAGRRTRWPRSSWRRGLSFFSGCFLLIMLGVLLLNYISQGEVSY